MSASMPPETGRFELRATVEGRTVVFDHLELWWSEAEPPEHDYPTFTLTTSADVVGEGPRVEVECPAPEATTFKDLAGETFELRPLSGEAGGGWVAVDFGRDYKAKGFPVRDWVARGAKIQFDSNLAEVLEGKFEAALERSASKGDRAGGGQIKLSGRFRAQAPRW